MAQGSTPQAVTRFKQRLTWGLGIAALLIISLWLLGGLLIGEPGMP